MINEPTCCYCMPIRSGAKAVAILGQGHPYPQQIDIPIGFVNSYTEFLEQPPCYQLHDPATNQSTHPAPNAREDIVAP
uniref:Uncharacterized protein n=1 Tax=Acrobeloides nanus TaxID=290746 RepID=A0A914DHB1_9BILA